MRGVFRFGQKGKLSPKFVRPYTITARVGPSAYRLELPSDVGNVHNVFHVSQLKKYVPHPSHVLTPDTLQLEPTLRYQETPDKILDTKTRETRNQSVRMVKVQWVNHTPEEATWELEDTIRAMRPDLFQ